MPKSKPLNIPKPEQDIIAKVAVDEQLRPRIRARAKILLMRAGGLGVCTVADQVGYERTSIWKIERKYEKWGIDSLNDRPRSGRPKDNERTCANSIETPRLSRNEGAKRWLTQHNIHSTPSHYCNCNLENSSCGIVRM